MVNGILLRVHRVAEAWQCGLPRRRHRASSGRTSVRRCRCSHSCWFGVLFVCNQKRLNVSGGPITPHNTTLHYSLQRTGCSRKAALCVHIHIYCQQQPHIHSVHGPVSTLRWGESKDVQRTLGIVRPNVIIATLNPTRNHVISV